MSTNQVLQPGAASARAPQGPRSQFLIGNTLEFQRDSLGFIQRMARQYGAVARFQLANMNIFQVNHPDGIQRILQDHNHNYLKGEFFGILRNIAGDGLFTSEGTFWLRQRRLMQPAFHRQRIAGFADMMVARIVELLTAWQPAAASGAAVDVSHAFSALTMQIISSAMFTTTVKADTERVGSAIGNLLEDINFRFTVPFYPGLNIPTLRNLRARAWLRTVNDVVYGIINERRQTGETGDDLLGMLMSARDADTGEMMDDLQLRNEVLTVFVAGHETTALALAWTFYLLAQNPQVAARLEAEVDQALQGRLPTMDDLRNLPYTRMVIDESLRLYPPAWVTNREAVAADELCGYHIPAGQVVLVSPYVMHRLPQYWDDPETFDPERFTPERSVGRPRFAYFPFGGGPHQCIGNSFALTEAVLILATIVQRYRLSLVPDQRIEPLPAVTLRLKHGLRMHIHER